MISCKVIIVNKLGLHARAAAKFVTLASQFKCEVELISGERRVNGKSIMGVLMLAASRGKTLEIIAQGADEYHAVARLEALVNQRFGEAE